MWVVIIPIDAIIVPVMSEIFSTFDRAIPKKKPNTNKNIPNTIGLVNDSKNKIQKPSVRVVGNR